MTCEKKQSNSIRIFVLIVEDNNISATFFFCLTTYTIIFRQDSQSRCCKWSFVGKGKSGKEKQQDMDRTQRGGCCVVANFRRKLLLKKKEERRTSGLQKHQLADWTDNHGSLRRLIKLTYRAELMLTGRLITSV